MSVAFVPAHDLAPDHDQTGIDQEQDQDQEHEGGPDDGFWPALESGVFRNSVTVHLPTGIP